MTVRNTTRYVFTAYGYKVIIGSKHVTIINTTTKYDVVYAIPEQLRDIKLYQPTVHDVLIEMIRKLIS